MLLAVEYSAVGITSKKAGPSQRDAVRSVPEARLLGMGIIVECFHGSFVYEVRVKVALASRSMGAYFG